MRVPSALLVLSLLYGCSGGGLIPGGPHSIDRATLRRYITDGARTNGLSVALVSAMVDTESHGDPAAISRAGAMGLMQLMPATASAYGVADAFNPEANIRGGCRYMHDLLARYHRNVGLALAAYNAGPAAVDSAHGVPHYAETRAYVARVTAAARSTTI